MIDLKEIAKTKVVALRDAGALPADVDVDATARKALERLEADEAFLSTIGAMVAATAAWAN